MPTEELFKRTQLPVSTRSLWSRSRDNVGRSWLAYVTPPNYQALTEQRIGITEYLSLSAQGKVLTLFEPVPKAQFGYTAEELRNLQVSPTIEYGIYDGDAQCRVYYMDDVNQYAIAYRLTKLSDLQFFDLIDPDDMTTGDKIRLRIREFLIGLVPQGTPETGWERLDGIIDWIQGQFDYSQFLAVWTVAGSVSEPISVVTSRPSTDSSGALGTAQATQRGTTNLFPLALVAGGLLAGSPLLSLGGGALLLLRRRDD